jgi:hypothetical protein
MKFYGSSLAMAKNLNVAFSGIKIVNFEVTSSTKENCYTFISANQCDRLTQQSFLELLFHLVTA